MEELETEDPVEGEDGEARGSGLQETRTEEDTHHQLMDPESESGGQCPD